MRLPAFALSLISFLVQCSQGPVRLAPQTCQRSRFASQRGVFVKVTFYTVIGVLLVAVAITALIRPRWTLPANKHEEMIANQRVLIETRRVITIPRVASATELVLGLGLIFFGSRPPREVARQRR